MFSFKNYKGMFSKEKRSGQVRSGQVRSGSVSEVTLGPFLKWKSFSMECYSKENCCAKIKIFFFVWLSFEFQRNDLRFFKEALVAVKNHFFKAMLFKRTTSFRSFWNDSTNPFN